MTLDCDSESITDIFDVKIIIIVFYLQALTSARTLQSVAVTTTAQIPKLVSIALVILAISLCLTSGLVLMLMSARRHPMSAARSVRT